MLVVTCIITRTHHCSSRPHDQCHKSPLKPTIFGCSGFHDAFCLAVLKCENESRDGKSEAKGRCTKDRVWEWVSMCTNELSHVFEDEDMLQSSSLQKSILGCGAFHDAFCFAVL